MLFTMLFAFTEILIQALMETSKQRIKELSGDITGGGSNRGKSQVLLPRAKPDQHVGFILPACTFHLIGNIHIGPGRLLKPIRAKSWRLTISPKCD